MFRTMAAVMMVALAGSAAADTVSPEKAALVQRVLAKMPMENVGYAMLQGPAADSLRQARAVLQGRVAPDKQEAALKDITAEVNKFIEENAPIIKNNTQQVVKEKVVPLMAQKFTEEELKQLAALLESPIKAKFESLLPELQKAVGEGVSAQLQPTIAPRMTALQEKIGQRMRAAINP